MTRIAIIDDEEIIRNSMKNIIDWASIDAEIIATCKNAKEAFDTILDEYPDIVITDIQMPGFSGLDLISWVNRAGLDTKFIILSGHDDFAYAKSAIKFGVDDYILKPCNNQELLTAVKKAIDSIKTQKPSPIDVDILNNKLQTEIINSVLSECITAKDTFPTMNTAYKYVEFHNYPYYLISIKDLAFKDLDYYAEIINTWKEKLNIDEYFHMLYANRELTLIFKNGSFSKQFIEMMKFKISQPATFDLCSCLLEVLEKILEQSMYIYQGYIIFGVDKVELLNNNLFSEQANVLKEAVDKGDVEKLGQVKQIIIKLMRGIHVLNFAKSQALLVLIELNICFPELFTTEHFAKITQDISVAEDIEDIVSVLEKHIHLGDKQKYTAFVQKIIDYVDENISNEELTLKQMSDTYLYMSANYVSQQFFKQTNVKFSHYINQKRVELAKKLLVQNGIDKIYLVAKDCGFGNNPQYFSQIFKKFVGISPTEYIKTYEYR